MCGRFVNTSTPERIAAYFGATPAAESLGENYNVAPTQDVLAVVERANGERLVEAFHWGLIPSWAKDRKIASRMINARAETLAEKPAFRGLFSKKRCIIPMDGFYEWTPGDPDGPLNVKGEPLKQPVFVHRADAEPLAVAGLWTRWKDPQVLDGAGDGERWLHSVTIVTTAANATIEPVHDRMPLTVPRDAWQRWLDPGYHDTAELASLFSRPDDHTLVMHRVSTDVNSVRNNGAELIAPV